MAQIYSTYEAKAKFSEIIRKVRAGQRIVVAYRGKEVAEISPLNRAAESFEDRLKRLEEEGVISRGRRPLLAFKPLGRKRGALARFLESRD